MARYLYGKLPTAKDSEPSTILAEGDPFISRDPRVALSRSQLRERTALEGCGTVNGYHRPTGKARKTMMLMEKKPTTLLLLYYLLHRKPVSN